MLGGVGAAPKRKFLALPASTFFDRLSVFCGVLGFLMLECCVVDTRCEFFVFLKLEFCVVDKKKCELIGVREFFEVKINCNVGRLEKIVTGKGSLELMEHFMVYFVQE